MADESLLPSQGKFYYEFTLEDQLSFPFFELHPHPIEPRRSDDIVSVSFWLNLKQYRTTTFFRIQDNVYQSLRDPKTDIWHVNVPFSALSEFIESYSSDLHPHSFLPSAEHISSDPESNTHTYRLIPPKSFLSCPQIVSFHILPEQLDLPLESPT